MARVQLKKRTDLHLARKIWHMGGVFTLFLIYVYASPAVSMTLMGLAWLAFVPADILRQKYPTLNEWILVVFKPIMRQTEVRRLAGTTFLLTGVLAVNLFFPRQIVALTLLFLAFADPIASYFGILYGKDKIFGHKSIQGFIAAFLVCTLVTYLYLNYHSFLVERLLLVSLFAGLVGAISEIVPVGKLDDNLTLPLMSAVGLTVLFYFFGFFVSVG